MNIVVLTLLIIVAVWTVFISIVFLVGLLSNRAKNKDENINLEQISSDNVDEKSIVPQADDMHSEVIPDDVGQDTVVEPVKIKSKKDKVKICLISILILWPLLSFGRYLYLDYAINKGTNESIDYTDVDVYNHPSQSVIESTMLNNPIIIHDRDYMMSFPIVRSKSIMNIRVRWLGDIIIKDVVGSDTCAGWMGKRCIGHCLYFNVWIYIILFLIMICRIRFYNINKLSKKTIITLCIIFALGILLLVRYLVLLQSEPTSGSRTAIRCTLLGNVYRDYEYVLDCVDYYDRVSVWLYNIYFGAATLIYPIVVFVLNKCHKNKQNKA